MDEIWYSKASQEVVIIEFGSKEAPQEDAQEEAQEASQAYPLAEKEQITPRTLRQVSIPTPRRGIPHPTAGIPAWGSHHVRARASRRPSDYFHMEAPFWDNDAWCLR
jgi:hypothetical protein